MMQDTGKYIVIAGLIVTIVGLIIWLGGDKLSWLGNLPGDVKVEKPGFKIYIPITTMIIVSIILSLIIWVIRQFVK